MRTCKRIISIAAICFGLAALAIPAMAQLNPFAPPEAMDELNSGSTGPNPAAYPTNPNNFPTGNPYQPRPNFGGAVDERTGAPVSGPASPYANFSTVPGEGGGTVPGEFGAEGGFAPPAAGGFAQPGQQSGFAPPAQPVTPKVVVLKGERYFDNFTRDLLEEAMVDEVPENELEGQYFDDGSSNDEIPGDNVFTNVTENYEYIGDVTHKLRKRYVGLLLAAESLEPIEFFRLIALTDDPLSTIQKDIELEEKRDEERLRVWNMRFLAFTRINPEDERSDFHPLYVPRAPAQPKSPLPQGFDPRPPKQEENQTRNGSTPAELAEGYWGGGAEGAPVGGASSRYY